MTMSSFNLKDCSNAMHVLSKAAIEREDELEQSNETKIYIS